MKSQYLDSLSDGCQNVDEVAITGVCNICDGHSISGKVLCLQMSQVSVLIWTTDVPSYGDVVVNVMRVVEYGWLHIWVTEAWCCGVLFSDVIGHLLWLLTWNLAVWRCNYEYHVEVTLYQQDNARPHSTRLTTDFLRQCASVTLVSVLPQFEPTEHLYGTS